MNVNKSLILINCNHDRRKEDNSSLDESDKSIIFIKLTQMSKIGLPRCLGSLAKVINYKVILLLVPIYIDICLEVVGV